MTAATANWEQHLAEHEARVAWLKKHLVKATAGMESEYSVTIADVAKFRMFRSPLNTREWTLVVHDPEESQIMRGMGFLFKVEGKRDRDTFRTREQVLSWIAIRWGFFVDKAMKAA